MHRQRGNDRLCRGRVVCRRSARRFGSGGAAPLATGSDQPCLTGQRQERGQGMITVLGAGAFGTALAISLARKGPVHLWAHDPDHAKAMQDTRRNDRRLPGVELSEDISISADIDTIPAQYPILLAVPMQRLRDVLTE